MEPEGFAVLAAFGFSLLDCDRQQGDGLNAFSRAAASCSFVLVAT